MKILLTGAAGFIGMHTAMIAGSIDILAHGSWLPSVIALGGTVVRIRKVAQRSRWENSRQADLLSYRPVCLVDHRSKDICKTFIERS